MLLIVSQTEVTWKQATEEYFKNRVPSDDIYKHKLYLSRIRNLL